MIYALAVGLNLLKKIRRFIMVKRLIRVPDILMKERV